MPEKYSKFLEGIADELRLLAEHAPDISMELRRFAQELDQMASELPRRRDGAPSQGAAD
jgi:hypothetical protein